MDPIALVGRVTDVQPHPENDKLNNKMDIVTIEITTNFSEVYARKRTNVANRESPDTPRYKVGDYAVMLEENTILPDWLMQHLGMWDDKKKVGMLGGKKKNRLRPRSIGIDTKITSEVALCPVWWCRLPDQVFDEGIRKTGILRFTENPLVDWPKDTAESTPCREIVECRMNDGSVSDLTVNYMLPVGEPKSVEIDDDFSPEGENVAWNLGIEEVYVGASE